MNVILLLSVYTCCGDVINAFEWVLIVILAYQQTHGYPTLCSVNFTA